MRIRFRKADLSRRKFSSLSLLIMLISLGMGCDQPPVAAYRDFSKTNAVGVVLGEIETEYDHGLQHLYHEKDGLTQPGAVRKAPCRCLELSPNDRVGYMYFKIDSTFKQRKLKKVSIDVEYFDEGEGIFGIQCDAATSSRDVGKAYTPVAGVAKLSRSRSWQIHTFEVQGATFRNHQNSGADFRLWIRPPELCVRSVVVTHVR